jgi:DNA-binding LacI/PurR family transcriptional regulator
VRSRRPTSADVARATGLSRATVSYVLNNTPHQVIPEATRRRVLEAAEALGYTPSAAARTLRSGRSDVILCLLPDWPIGVSVGLLLQGLSTSLAAEGLTFVAHPRAPHDRPISEVWKSITPAAVITFEDLPAADAAGLRNAGIDLTVALFGVNRRGPNVLGLPEERTGRLQAEHLAASGHRHLAYAAPDDPRVDRFAEARLEGVRTACADLGLSDPQVRRVPLDAGAAAEAIAAWRGSEPTVTGVCAYNDEVALAVLAGARRTGIAVPEDLAVVGVDNIPAAALAEPPLTTVATDSGALADHIARTITAGLGQRPRPRRPGSDIHRVVVRRSG